MTRPTYVSLFSGVGGFDMGMDNAGFTCVAQVELDKHCQTILHRHWPHTQKWGDISTVSGYELPDADGIIFGSPCQDLSVAGKRAGLDGGRSGLFHEAVRIMKEMQDGSNGTFPRFAIWENVPGALSSNQGQDFGVVLDEMAQLGALAIEWAVLDARWFGVPQRRRRIFLVAIFDPAIAARCPNPLLPISPRRNWNPPTSESPGETVTGGTSEGAGGNTPMLAEPVPLAFDSQFGSYANVHEDISPPVKVGSGIDIASPPAVMTVQYATRRLTPLECERLQGWPDDHTRWKADGTEQADNQRYKQCGNGVATPVAQWVAQQLLPLLSYE